MGMPGGSFGGAGGGLGGIGGLLKIIGMRMKKGAAGLIADEGLKASDKPWVGNKRGGAMAANFTPSGLAQFWSKIEQNPALKQRFMSYLQQGKINRPPGGFRQGGGGGMAPTPQLERFGRAAPLAGRLAGGGMGY
jgi:hypothetical protein